jgi:hypothetical protein
MRFFAGALIATVSVAACREAPSSVICARPGIASVVAVVRDDHGRASAIGAIVQIANTRGNNATAKGFGDSLRVSVFDDNAGGSFNVTVTKPWYKQAVALRVNVPEDACGVRSPTEVGVTLALLPGAPPVRQVAVAPFSYGLFAANLVERLTAYVDADANQSHAVSWTSRDSSVATVTSAGVMTSMCRRTKGTTWAVATSVADPTVRDSLSVEVWPDSNPSHCPAR